MPPVDTYQAEYETKFKKELSYFPECSLFLPPCFYSLSNVYGAPTTGPWVSFKDLKVEKDSSLIPEDLYNKKSPLGPGFKIILMCVYLGPQCPYKLLQPGM